MKFLLVLSFTLFWVISDAQERDSSFYDNIANELCTCSSDFIKVYSDVQQLYDENKRTEAEELKQSSKSIYQQFGTCLDEMLVNYPQMDRSSEFKRRGEESIVKRCPDLARILRITPKERAPIVDDDSEYSRGNQGKDDTIKRIEDKALSYKRDKSWDDVDEAPVEIKSDPKDEVKPKPIKKEHDAYMVSYATELCECLNKEEALLKEYRMMKNVQSSQRWSEFIKGLSRKYPSFYTCSQEVIKNHSKIQDSSENSVKAMSALRAYCPDILGLFKL